MREYEPIPVSEQRKGRRASAPRRAALPIALLLAVVGLVVGIGAIRDDGTGAAQAQPALPPSVTELEKTFIQVAEQVKPAVVHLRVKATASVKDDPMETIPAPLRPFVPMPTPQPRQRTGTGSGVIIDTTGYILTNVHVVKDAAEITVITSADEETYSGKVVGTDPDTDLAVVKIDPGSHRLTAAKLGDADRERVGTMVMAIGSPFGLDATVTNGILSAKERTLRRDESAASVGQAYYNLLQTDAAINPGNSGGPLSNLRGEVIGINQAIYSPGPFGGNVGIGFAIPINSYTKGIIEAIKEGKPVVRGRLGAMVRDMSPALAQTYGVRRGAFVEQVMPGSPAAAAGVQGEDVITRFGDRPIESSDQLVTAVQSTQPGTEVKITLIREKKERTVTVRIERRPDATTASTPAAPESGAMGRLGLRVGPLPPRLAAQGVRGVLVIEVDPSGEAAEAGVVPEDVITKVNLTPVASVEEYSRAVAALRAGQAATLRVRRGEDMRTVEIDEVAK